MSLPSAATPPDHRSAEIRMLAGLGACLHPACVIRIEYASAPDPRRPCWSPWGAARVHDGDLEALFGAIDACRARHPDQQIRLRVDDLRWHSALALVVYRPRPRIPA
ncbi:ribulose bisphosphate carboxylase small subunit [Marichromatium bheemlicum]|uniref:Ribulose 1,5-bisphosphate carboxylase small subunit n=1 Tax=Marichromatium bheemlicum TaxID=365339 RepID=A0ABX1I756_9GAMM|nr:ribulose bisphosphate carboxylase small subunit [Marichromatium bheemlicum]NKN32779.1 ribulose 1,5-bisphosphate carboxylase small subunit [Marichromatium bheemlicum]